MIIVIAHENLILLKQDLEPRCLFAKQSKNKAGESECLYSQGLCLLKVFGLLHNPYRSVLEYVSSAYRIAFAGESKRD